MEWSGTRLSDFPHSKRNYLGHTLVSARAATSAFLKEKTCATMITYIRRLVYHTSHNEIHTRTRSTRRYGCLLRSSKTIEFRFVLKAATRAVTGTTTSFIVILSFAEIHVQIRGARLVAQQNMFTDAGKCACVSVDQIRVHCRSSKNRDARA